MDSYKDPKPGKAYFSPSLPSFSGDERKVRIASKVIDSPESYAFGTIKNEVVIRRKEGGSRYISAKFFEDDRGIFVLSIQGYSNATDKPHNASFSFIGEEIGTLIDFIANIKNAPLKSSSAVNISDEALARLSRPQAQALVEGNEALFAEIVASSITRQDVIAVSYRKKQLEVFSQLLNDIGFFNRVKAQKGCTDEGLWQRFFQKNPWIFGYGLNYIYLDSLNDKKLEQVVHGHQIGSHGKRIDALMKSKGLISTLCFIEIKTHKTPLLGRSPYRAGCWPASAELTGAVAQTQGTVSSAMDTIRGKLSISDSDGFPTGEDIFNFSPKAFIVVGNLEEFVGDKGVNQDQLRSFELFRRNMFLPEIITFDELYERAKCIVQISESQEGKTPDTIK